jgi:3-deoxy-D-manno-octulosonate 8-phosphate phosphatase (KDO 8-P phosphatase)
MQNSHLTIESIDAVVLDFDGVLTNNLVHLDQDGKEWVSCNRADGLAFDVMRKLKKPSYILSTETNLVVSARAKKLKIPVIQGIKNKADTLLTLSEIKGYNLDRILYVGNDLNDYAVMKLCGYTACPSDSHPKIKSISDIILNATGGNGVVRELLEEVLNIDFIKTLYQTNQ